MSSVSILDANPIAKDGYPGLNTIPDLNSSYRIHDSILLKNPLVPYSIIAIYILFVKWIGPEIMKHRKPFSLQKVLILYNLLQAAANVYIAHIAVTGVAKYWDDRCVVKKSPKLREMLEMALKPGFYLYVIKFIDLLDTVFFILRKKQKQVSFLHVFHHAGMCFGFYWGLNNIYKHPAFYMAVGFAINTQVHVIMYLYYGLAAIGPKMQKYLWWKKYLTLLQIGQIVFVLAYMIYGLLTGCEEFGDLEFYGLIYASLTLLLFLNFYRKYKKE